MRMSHSRGHLQKQKLSTVRNNLEVEHHVRSAQHVQLQPQDERRSKHNEELHAYKITQSDYKARMLTPPMKKQKVVEELSDFESDEVLPIRQTKDLNKMQQHSRCVSS